ncbi:SAP30-binding protein [Capsicum galapagoense]
MASHKKELEGSIAQLAVYGDDDDEEEEEQHEKEEEFVNVVVHAEEQDEDKQHEKQVVVEFVNVVVHPEEQKEVDMLENFFLHPPPKEKCSMELQAVVEKFLDERTKTGRSFNADLRSNKGYRNPDLLEHLVNFHKIDQIGSCFSKDVFDPHGYNKSDFYDEIETQAREVEIRREQERQRTSAKVVIIAPWAAGDGRQKKKSKWDKVDPVSTVGAHAGAGYAAFVQQKRQDQGLQHQGVHPNPSTKNYTKQPNDKKPIR